MKPEYYFVWPDERALKRLCNSVGTILLGETNAEMLNPLELGF